ncbi:hypothetical protein FACS1894193_11540 [Bacilli bacterium]|nr:hypothetical protein FACS1894192_04760 [Bacilli bacterium]GHU43917.1 hypothetical protein FACS1894193_11540 [Bacilli bacterium]
MNFDKNGAYEVELQGCVYCETENLTADGFLDKFISFVEENGWYFGGGTKQIIDGYYVDGTLKPIKPVDE